MPATLPKYLLFDPATRRPGVPAPERSCDAHFHVYGPVDRYPVRSGAAYEMPSATAEAARRMHQALGIDRGVVVQSTAYGADHQVVLDALLTLGRNYRGCASAIVFDEADDRYLARLHDAGVNGVRFSFRKELGVVASEASFRRAIARAKELGWYVKIHPETNGIVDSAAMYEDLDVPVLIDHMGRADPRAGADSPNMRKMLELLAKGNFWVGLSLGEKVSRTGYPWRDVLPIARAFLEAAPDRCVWGSDWPHPLSMVQPPNDAELIELAYSFCTSEAERRRLFVENAAALFGFER